MSEVIRVTSEALQSTIRDLLPSQNGFGDDLMASNVIIPTIDLTASAEGSQIGQNLQTALGFDSMTAHSVYNQTSTLINTTGFFRIFGNFGFDAAAGSIAGNFNLSDGLSTKTIWGLGQFTAGSGNIDVDFVVFINAGDSFSCSASAGTQFNGSSRQIADINGNLVNPTGFSSE